MLPRDLGCRDYNVVLRGEARLLAHGSSEDNGRSSSTSFHPRGVEYRLLPVLQVKPDYAVPYVLCWRVPSTTIHRIQVPLQHHHHHHHHHRRRRHYRHHRQHHRYQRRYRQRCRRHFQATATPRRHPVPFLAASAYTFFPYGCNSSDSGDPAAAPGMETRWALIISFGPISIRVALTSFDYPPTEFSRQSVYAFPCFWAERGICPLLFDFRDYCSRLWRVSAWRVGLDSRSRRVWLDDISRWYFEDKFYRAVIGSWRGGFCLSLFLRRLSNAGFETSFSPIVVTGRRTTQARLRRTFFNVSPIFR